LIKYKGKKFFQGETMLELRNIVKNYHLVDNTVEALKGISVKFRRSEFVSVLGPSGCGKTTLLNIIGGLDRYTTGDLLVDGRSTREFKNNDWDTYRNHSIGFVFQSYNLIPHQTVLENVELALTLSGVSKQERRKRATDVLGKVGLTDKLNSKPNQLSGGQMQRVAIARALINDPEILLADEPTGALDSKTSVQIMEILKAISRERLIIMVTHNPELAEKYSTRIIKLLDGNMVDDSMPFDGNEEIKITNVYKGRKKTSMSLITALSLSLRNLMTKKGRTFLVSFAGSIGIIGIALILSLSSGFQTYIDNVQKDTLSNYPVTISSEASDYTSMLSSMMKNSAPEGEKYPDNGKITSDDVMGNMMNSKLSTSVTNDLKTFKEYLKDYDTTKISAVQYTYNFDFTTFDTDNNQMPDLINDIYKAMEIGSASSSYMSSYTSAYNVWTEMLDSEKLLQSQYEVISGKWADPSDPYQVVVAVDEYNRIPDYALVDMGLKSENDILYPLMLQMFVSQGLTKEQAKAYLAQQGITEPAETEVDFDIAKDVIGRQYKLSLNSDMFYKQDDGTYIKAIKGEDHYTESLSKTVAVKVVGVVRQKKTATSGSINGTIAYNSSLTKLLLNKIAESDVIKAQLANIETNVLTGKAFDLDKKESYSVNMKNFGYATEDNPYTISIYPTSFENKDYVIDLINSYNDAHEEAQHITYTDYLGLIMSSIDTIINAISYILIGFVSISLIVSSIMIGIITYISVLERIKEIGILRAIGASKRDISRVFNAEAVIIGFAAGVIGILFTLLLNIPINLIIGGLSGIYNVAKLPVVGGIVLVVISVLLTFIAGLIPAGIAAKKDPVEALRSE